MLFRLTKRLQGRQCFKMENHDIFRVTSIFSLYMYTQAYRWKCIPRKYKCTPANFFRDIRVRFLSWECWDFWRRHNHFREEVWRSPKSSEEAQCLLTTPEVFRSLRMRKNANLLPGLLTSKIRDRKEGIVIYSFYTWFSFLTWVWVKIFLEIVSRETATTHIFQSDVRNWPASVSGVRSKLSTRRRETHAQDARVGRSTSDMSDVSLYTMS